MSSESTTSQQAKRPRLNEPITQRKFTKIPIFIVEYHNEVLDFIYRSLASRHLPFEGNTMLHFDSHPDMVISREIPASAVFKKDELLEKLSIENWIMPACYAGHFKKIVWAKNSWCDQLPIGSHNFAIGDQDDKICVSFPVDYFISEGNYCEEKCLKNVKHIKLEVIDSDKNQKLEILENDDNLVLDIDLDFFSTSNPFLNIYDEAETYKKLQKIFCYDDNVGTDAERVKEMSDNRKEQLEYLQKVFNHLEINRTLDGFINDGIFEDILEKIKQLVIDIYEEYDDFDVDWNLVYDAGCTCDHNGLPHHISTEIELDGYMKNFEDVLTNLTCLPVLITISRSSVDNYCPPQQVDGIQRRVIEILGKVFHEKLSDKPILAYREDVWDVMNL